MYVESHAADVELINEELEEHVARLQTLLNETWDVDTFVDLEALKEAIPLPVFQAESACSTGGLAQSRRFPSPRANRTSYAVSPCSNQGGERAPLVRFRRRWDSGQREPATSLRTSEAHIQRLKGQGLR